LNRPLITAHITIILSEEENQVSPLACIAPDPSQSSEHSRDKDSPEIGKSEKSDQEEFLKSIPPLEEISPADEEGIHDGASHSMAVPVSEMVGNESMRISSAGLVEGKKLARIRKDSAT